jgi:hypothetical protein
MDDVMRTGKRFVAGIALGAVLTMGMAAPARAAKLEIVFKDGLWGAAIGGLIGLAQVAGYKKPDNEWHRVGDDAIIGVFFGIAFGFVEASGAFASYDRERSQLALGVPAVRYTRDEHGTKVMADLLEARF